MSDETIETLRANIDIYTNKLINNPKNHRWIYDINTERTFIKKKQTIEDFQLIKPKNSKDTRVNINNSIKLYENLKELPMYVLTDEKFWNWINFEKYYEVALLTMPVKKGDAVLKDHWLFSQGDRRSVFFGVFSRAYFRVALSVDELKKDPYELTRFVIEKSDRFRNLTWRTYSSEKHIVMGALKAEKQILDEFGYDYDKSKYYTKIAKYISKLGSVMLLDAMSENDIYDYVYKEYKRMILDEKRLR